MRMRFIAPPPRPAAEEIDRRLGHLGKAQLAAAAIPQRGEIDRAEDQQPRQLRLDGEPAVAAQGLERRLPGRVVVVLQLDDAAPLGLGQRAPVVEHHRDEVQPGPWRCVVRADQRLKRSRGGSPGSSTARVVSRPWRRPSSITAQHLDLVAEVIEGAARLHADGVGDVADRRAFEALFAEQPRRRADESPRRLMSSPSASGAGSARRRATGLDALARGLRFALACAGGRRAGMGEVRLLVAGERTNQAVAWCSLAVASRRSQARPDADRGDRRAAPPSPLRRGPRRRSMTVPRPGGAP